MANKVKNTTNLRGAKQLRFEEKTSLGEHIRI